MLVNIETLDFVKEDLLQTLYNSCQEGYSGVWDSSTLEGKEGFLDMQEIILYIARDLKIDIDISSANTDTWLKQRHLLNFRIID